jgi:ABC-type Na+ efflux pump permease subunit
MPPTPPNRLAAMKEDGFVDFYELLGVEEDATLTRLRTTINALYNESQANRDHRNLNRRREYQTLLQLLPQARELLLDEKKRERYDAFREDHKRGVTTISFESWTRQLQEEEETENAGKSAVLGVQGEEDAPQSKSPTASVTKVPLNKPKAKPRSRVVVEEGPNADATRSSLMGTVVAIIVGFAFFALLNFVIKLDFPLAIIAGVIACVIVFIITHRKGTGKTAV